MILFPAIDIKQQQCVRLIQGDMKTYTVYNAHPEKVAKSFVSEGAAYLHVVDLDRATYQTSDNMGVIQTIRQSIDIPMQVGGGIRSFDDVKVLLDVGIDRVIVGTIAVNDIDLVKRMASKYPGRIVVSIDAKNGQVATHGWQKVSSLDALDLCKQLESIGITTIVYTDIAKDGMLEGPNFDDYARLKKHTSLDIIASGGISSLDDLIKLQQMGLYGAIIGKALYEKRFSLKEAIACLPNVSSPV